MEPRLLLSTAYLPPIQYFVKLFYAPENQAYIEANEHFIKQSFRNRAYILGANGITPLSIPIEQGKELKTAIREVRISDHGNWRHLHTQAIVSAYGSSPYFEYYWDDLRIYWERPYSFLWDLNTELTEELCRLLHLSVRLEPTTDFVRPEESSRDYRYSIRPKNPIPDPSFHPQLYYQLFSGTQLFQPNLSILDLLFNMGTEAILTLRDSGEPKY